MTTPEELIKLKKTLSGKIGTNDLYLQSKEFFAYSQQARKMLVVCILVANENNTMTVVFNTNQLQYLTGIPATTLRYIIDRLIMFGVCPSSTSKKGKKLILNFNNNVIKYVFNFLKDNFSDELEVVTLPQ